MPLSANYNGTRRPRLHLAIVKAAAVIDDEGLRVAYPGPCACVFCSAVKWPAGGLSQCVQIRTSKDDPNPSADALLPVDHHRQDVRLGVPGLCDDHQALLVVLEWLSSSSRRFDDQRTREAI